MRRWLLGTGVLLTLTLIVTVVLGLGTRPQQQVATGSQGHINSQVVTVRQTQQVFANAVATNLQGSKAASVPTSGNVGNLFHTDPLTCPLGSAHYTDSYSIYLQKPLATTPSAVATTLLQAVRTAVAAMPDAQVIVVHDSPQVLFKTGHYYIRVTGGPGSSSIQFQPLPQFQGNGTPYISPFTTCYPLDELPAVTR